MISCRVTDTCRWLVWNDSAAAMHGAFDEINGIFRDFVKTYYMVLTKSANDVQSEVTLNAFFREA